MRTLLSISVYGFVIATIILGTIQWPLFVFAGLGVAVGVIVRQMWRSYRHGKVESTSAGAQVDSKSNAGCLPGCLGKTLILLGIVLVLMLSIPLLLIPSRHFARLPFQVVYTADIKYVDGQSWHLDETLVLHTDDPAASRITLDDTDLSDAMGSPDQVQSMLQARMRRIATALAALEWHIADLEMGLIFSRQRDIAVAVRGWKPRIGQVFELFPKTVDLGSDHISLQAGNGSFVHLRSPKYLVNRTYPPPDLIASEVIEQFEYRRIDLTAGHPGVSALEVELASWLLRNPVGSMMINLSLWSPLLGIIALFGAVLSDELKTHVKRLLPKRVRATGTAEPPKTPTRHTKKSRKKR